MKTIISTWLVLLIFINVAKGQRELQALVSSAPDEVVSLSSSLPFDQAMQMLSKLSKQFINKVIVMSEDIVDPIGVDIISMNWYRALQLILRVNNLNFSETADYIKILPRIDTAAVVVPDAMKGVNLSTREVNISAIFFEMDIAKSKSVGMNWKWLLSKGSKFNIAAQLGNVDTTIFNINATSTENTFNLGAKSQVDDVFGFLGRATALFNFFEENDLGEIIASPQITVRDRMKGQIQVGADFSTREKDFAGNTIERFYSTGTIIRVTPYVFEDDGKKYILIDLEAERSTANPGQISTEIKKTKALTNVLLVDGEETVIGGLYITEEKSERNGIPILKDLPWWVFGIRYLTGSDSKVLTKKELIIVLKAKLEPTLEERFAMKKEERNVLQERRERNLNEIKFYQMTPTEEK